MTTVEVFAPAKVNLTLHVTGQRPDGYHDLDSLVVFADLGDRLTVSRSEAASFDVSGPEAAGVPRDATNSVMRVAEAFDALGPHSIRLEKMLPAAAGIGGGSADAAACYRGLTCLAGGPDQAAREFLAGVGADNLMCLGSFPVRARGTGDVLEPVAGMPELPAVLVNPHVPVPTPAVFGGLEKRKQTPMPDRLPRFSGPAEIAGWLRTTRNDLEAPALAIAPVIGDVLGMLGEARKILFARMSGSGATCFGLFPDAASARAAADAVALERPHWWVRAVSLGDRSAAARPIPLSPD